VRRLADVINRREDKTRTAPFKYPLFFVTGHCWFIQLRHGISVSSKKIGFCFGWFAF